MHAVIQSLKHAPTIRAMRHVLQSWGLDGSRDCNSGVYCGSLEFVAAAALARATVGA